MLIQPLPQETRRARRRQPETTVSGSRTAPAAVASITTMTDEQEGAAFMAFLGDHSAFAATHKGA